MTDTFVASEPETNGDAVQAELERNQTVIRRQELVIGVLRQRVIELELQVVNERCEALFRDD
jgi:hypothetical protein